MGTKLAKFYLSNIRPAWPFERQEALLDAKAPGWRSGAVYRDALSARKRQGHGAADLKQRETMLRPTRRPAGEDVIVPALPVLDWSVRGLLAVLTALSERGSTLKSLDCGTIVPPNDVGAAAAAVAEFERACRRIGDPRQSGGIVSGERRAARAKAACEALSPYWRLPSADYPTASLLKKYGVSRPTAIAYLGPRGEAQRAYQHAISTAERNQARKQRREAPQAEKEPA
jgi:hypothetical protein